MHDFLADSFVFLEDFIIGIFHDFAVESIEESGFFEFLIIPHFDGIDFGQKKMVIFLDIMNLFWEIIERGTVSCELFFLFGINEPGLLRFGYFEFWFL